MEFFSLEIARNSSGSPLTIPAACRHSSSYRIFIMSCNPIDHTNPQARVRREPITERRWHVLCWIILAAHPEPAVPQSRQNRINADLMSGHPFNLNQPVAQDPECGFEKANPWAALTPKQQLIPGHEIIVVGPHRARRRDRGLAWMK